MLGLADLEIGLLFWAGQHALRTLEQVRNFGVRAGQIGFPGDLRLEGTAEEWDRALTDDRFTVVTAFCSYIGEDYADIPTVARTVGLVPPDTRKQRLQRTKEVSKVAKDLGIDSIGCHIGVIAPDHKTSAYDELLKTTREICDCCKENGQSLALETGQEPAKVLCRFIEEVERSNLKINFDPANMILYGTGEPLEALDAVGKYVVSVHCKDADWPPREHPNALGKEMPLGQGKVGIPEFISKLKEIGYKSVLNIESEESDPAQRASDIRQAISLLKQLTSVPVSSETSF